MTWLALIIVSVLLLVVAGELALIILWGLRRKPEALLERLRDDQTKLLETIQGQWKAQDEWAEKFERDIQNLINGLPSDPELWKRLRASALSDEDQRNLAIAALSLSASVSDHKSLLTAAPAEMAGQLGALAVRFERAVESLGAIVGQGIERAASEQLKLSRDTAERASAQHEAFRQLLIELRAMIEREAATQNRRDRSVLEVSSAPAAPTPPSASELAVASDRKASLAPEAAPVASAQPGTVPPSQEASVERQGEGAEAAESAVPQVASPASPAPPLAPPAPPVDTGFEPFQSWLLNNLEQVMNRSLNKWHKPEELLSDVPAELRFTAELLDREAKLVLVGLQGDTRYLALALPGGKIDKMNVEWFIIEQGGMGGRVERTIAPAVLEASASGYRVLRRGVVKPD